MCFDRLFLIKDNCAINGDNKNKHISLKKNKKNSFSELNAVGAFIGSHLM
jgi:hypothetical protein